MIKNKTSIINYANRGMYLENGINITNDYYIEKDIAIIHKKPTPIKVTKVDYKTKSKLINEAYYEKASTTDYNGIYKGKYIDFDAKEVKNSESFALANVHKHQLDHLTKIYNHGGISFLIVKFYFNNKTYLLETKEIINFVNNNTRKSIPVSYFESNGHIIKEGYIPRLDYIKIIDNLYFKEIV